VLTLPANEKIKSLIPLCRSLQEDQELATCSDKSGPAFAFSVYVSPMESPVLNPFHIELIIALPRIDCSPLSFAKAPSNHRRVAKEQSHNAHEIYVARMLRRTRFHELGFDRQNFIA
jgi:hypothetical protein